MVIKLLHTRQDLYYAAVAYLNHFEWPPVSNALDDDEWINRPVRQWVLERAPDSCFTCNGTVFFRNKEDSDWLRMVWEQAP